jgi:two-component system chemotaxis response regulator CheB
MAIRVLIVDDSRIVRGVLRRVLEHFSDIQVVGEAGDGKRAEQLVAELRPDVLTIDLLMPFMGGIETIERIMRDHPTPIVVVADLDGSDRALAREALARGACEVYPKPRLGFDAKAACALVEALRRSAAAPSPDKDNHNDKDKRRARPATPAWPPARRGAVATVGIVASTGGPCVLRDILRSLPRGLPCSIAIVQHTTVGATEPLADWLGSQSGHPVRVARAGERLGPGHIVVAPDHAHLLVTADQTVVLDHGPRTDSHRPSGTLLLKSMAQYFRSRSVGVVLSGVGSDGADGVAEIEAAGGSVLIEDPATAVVSGMPAAALSRTQAALVEPAAELGGALLRLLGKPSATT